MSVVVWKVAFVLWAWIIYEARVGTLAEVEVAGFHRRAGWCMAAQEENFFVAFRAGRTGARTRACSDRPGPGPPCTRTVPPR